MMSNIKYRASLTPIVPTSTTLKGAPLTNLELDGNFKSLSDSVLLRATLASPTFTGVVTVPTPTNGTDASTRLYVDTTKQELKDKESVLVASTVNINIATGLINNVTIDDVIIATGNRVLLKNQTATTENGIYVVVASGVVASRSTDANTSSKVTSGMDVFVTSGTISGSMSYTLTTVNPIELGVTPLTFSQTITAGAGLKKDGNILNIIGTANRISVADDAIDIGTEVVTLTSSATLTNKILTMAVLNGTITGDSQATANTASTLVMRDAVGNFSAGTMTGTATDVSNFTSAVSTTAPNATVPVVSFTATNAATNVDFALKPKGSGALTAHIADNLAAGGNKRGINAVDWQSSRSNADGVAGGAYSTIGGGSSSLASGTNATVAGGASNTASGNFATVAGGTANTANATSCTVSGGNTNAAGGGSNATVGGGSGNTASGLYSTIPGGYSANTQGITGKYAYASGRFVDAGDCQRGSLTLRRETTNATASTLGSDGSAGGADNQLILQNNQMMTVQGQVAARRNIAGGAELAAFEFTAVINRVASAAATTLHASTLTSLFNNITGLSATPLVLTADTVNGGLAITVTGVAATNIRWLCTVNTSEVIAGA